DKKSRWTFAAMSQQFGAMYLPRVHDPGRSGRCAKLLPPRQNLPDRRVAEQPVISSRLAVPSSGDSLKQPGEALRPGPVVVERQRIPAPLLRDPLHLRHGYSVIMMPLVDSPSPDVSPS